MKDGKKERQTEKTARWRERKREKYSKIVFEGKTKNDTNAVRKRNLFLDIGARHSELIIFGARASTSPLSYWSRKNSISRVYKKSFFFSH